MSSAPFQKLWLDTDTRIGKLEPTQIRQLRALCEKFYEGGRKVALDDAELIKTIAFQRILELRRLEKELNTLKWSSADGSWDLAIEAVRTHIFEVCAGIFAAHFETEALAIRDAQAAIEKAMGK